MVSSSFLCVDIFCSKGIDMRRSCCSHYFSCVLPDTVSEKKCSPNLTSKTVHVSHLCSRHCLHRTSAHRRHVAKKSCPSVNLFYSAFPPTYLAAREHRPGDRDRCRRGRVLIYAAVCRRASERREDTHACALHAIPKGKEFRGHSSPPPCQGVPLVQCCLPPCDNP